MAEEKEEERTPTIGDMGIDQFFSVLVHVLNERQGKGEPRLMEMTMKEFSESMIEVFKTRAYTTAVAETNVAERILTDWKTIQSVQAVTQPFRISGPADAEKFGADLKDYFLKGGRGEMAVAVAVVSPEGGARRYGGP